MMKNEKKRLTVAGIALVAWMFLVPGESAGQLVKSGVIAGPDIGCLSGDAFKQIGMAINDNDVALRDSMMGTVCTVIVGMRFSLLDGGILTSKIRVYYDGGFVDLIVASETVRF